MRLLRILTLFFAFGSTWTQEQKEDECFIQTTSVDGVWNKLLCLNSSAPGTVYVVNATMEEDDPSLNFRLQDDTVVARTVDMDTMYLIFAGCLIFLMQTGFALLEAGAVELKNVQNILFKNLMDASLGALVWYFVGYGFAYGGDDDGPFIGVGHFALHPELDPAKFIDWFFQYTFAATAATIVSGSVAERCKLSTYFTYAFILTLWVYPVVVHWVWDPAGWLNVLGVVDFAGSGVVHLVGGCCGLVGAALVGPRQGIFDEDGQAIETRRQPHKVLLQAVGTTILWFGWYGFNCGSTLAISNSATVASRVAIVTTLSAASGALTTAILGRILFLHYDLGAVFNGILTGLVAICACVATVETYVGIIVGFLGGCFYLLGSRLLLLAKIDDPLDAFPVHGVGGMLGLLCPAMFSSSRLLSEVYSDEHAQNYISGKQFGIQLAALVAIAAWTLFHAFLIFGGMKCLFGIRIDREVEEIGIDKHEHGGDMYGATYARPALKPNLSRIFTPSEVGTPKRKRNSGSAPHVELIEDMVRGGDDGPGDTDDLVVPTIPQEGNTEEYYMDQPTPDPKSIQI